MFLPSPAKIYLTEVLGLREILRPSLGELPLASSWKVEGDEQATLVVVFAESLTAAHQELWQRLSDALKIASVRMVSGSGSAADLVALLAEGRADKGIVFGTQGASDLGFGAAALGERREWAGVQWCVTHALSEMLGNGPAVAAHKKATWNHLQEHLK